MNRELVFVLIFLTLLLGSCAVIDTLSTNPDAGRYTPEDYEYWEEAPEGLYYD